MAKVIATAEHSPAGESSACIVERCALVSSTEVSALSQLGTSSTTNVMRKWYHKAKFLQSPFLRWPNDLNL